MSCHMSISFRPFVPFCEQKTIQKSVSGTKFFLRPGLLVSLWPVCNDSQCFHIHHYHPAENITPDWSFYILWCIGINGKFDLCSVFYFYAYLLSSCYHWVKHTDKKMCIFCQKCVWLKNIFCPFSKRVLSRQHLFTVIYGTSWRQKEEKGSGSAVYHIYIHRVMIIQWLCIISIYIQRKIDIQWWCIIFIFTWKLIVCVRSSMTGKW